MRDKDSQLIYEAYLIQEDWETTKLDKLQMLLDIVGIEPSVGTAADIINSIISAARAIADKDRRKEHIVNMIISLVSMIPAADVVKLVKKPYRKAAVKGMRYIKNTGKQAKQDRAIHSAKGLTSHDEAPETHSQTQAFSV
tara:strand:- start:6603 stop:7022 length:420 start_codon:yes stop_codon:yes gene_type:complete